MDENEIKQKRIAFLKELADLLEKHKVTLDVDSTGAWESGTPELMFSGELWSTKTLTGSFSWNAEDIRTRLIEKE
jgi:hypothetical protein